MNSNINDNKVNIDLVVLWVDSSDDRWQAKFLECSKLVRPGQDIDPCRFRDWGNLLYVFRGVDRFLPWINHIYLVTDEQCPQWLELSDRVTVIDHKDIIPSDRLPSFNSNNIELFLHKIPGLSEQFIYINDDVFFLRDMSPTDFFVDGIPVDMLALQPVVANPSNPVMTYIYTNNSVALCKHFDKKQLMKKYKKLFFHPGYPIRYFVYNHLEKAFPKFTGFYTVHGPSPMLKSVYERVWDLEPEALLRTAPDFRSNDDVSQYLIREWNKLEGNIIPRNIVKNFEYFDASDNNNRLVDVITKQKKQCICINDTGEFTDFEKTKAEINQALDSILPNKSAFEK